MSEAYRPELARLRKLHKQITGYQARLPDLVAERDGLIFELISKDVTERHIARETGISRGAIWKAKNRRSKSS